MYRYLFGPVPSRRLGKSLGIDLIAPKTCSLDCIYCECGKTTNLSIDRKIFVPTNEVIEEISHFIQNNSNHLPDFFSFSGAGEPTLASNIGEIIRFLKQNQLRSAVITNSTLLDDKNLLEDLALADIVLPSLDAVLETTFQKINRPISSLRLDKIIQSLIHFRKNFSGKIYLEIFIIPGLNTSLEELSLFKEIILQINPDKVQLNSLDRPGTENVYKAPKHLLEKIQELWNLPYCEIIGNYSYSKQENSFSSSVIQEEQLLLLLQKRPATIEDLCLSLQTTPPLLQPILDQLIENKKISLVIEKRGIFYLNR